MPQAATAAPAIQPDAAERRLLPLQQRAASVSTSTFDRAARTVDVIWSTGAMVRRYDWATDTIYDEELAISADAIDMTRLASGRAPVLDSHARYSVRDQIGVVQSARLDSALGPVATLRLSGRDDLAGIVQDIADGIICNISAGYSVQRMEIIPAASRTDGGTVPIWRATRWTPAELSFTPVGADPGAHARSEPAAQLQPGQGGATAPSDAASPDAALPASPCEFVTRAPAAYHSTPQRTTSMPATTATPADDTTAAGATASTTASPTAAADVQRAAPPQPAAATVAADIVAECVRHNVPALAADLIRSGQTLDQARAAILTELSRSSATARPGHAGGVYTVRDEAQTRAAGIAEALLHRVAPQATLTDNGRQYRGMSLLDICRGMLESHGINTRGMDKMSLAGQALLLRSAGMLASGDFSSLLGNVASKRLRMAYDENPGTYTRWARRAPNAPDFKSMSVVQLSGAPSLLQTNEHGEFKYGSLTDSGETYGVLTYGRIVSLTRQAIVNDDLRGFDRLTTAYGFAARRLENRLVYAQLTDNGTMADTGALFNATAVTTAGGHANLLSGGTSALQFSSLVAGRLAMRKQVGLAGEELNIAPSYLIGPAALEQTMYQLTSAAYTPATKAEINEFRAGGRTALEPIVEPLLDGTSATAWYLAASTSQVDTVEYCYLDGAEGPVIESEPGFEVDGVSYKCRLDFAAKALDFRGLLKSAGA